MVKNGLWFFIGVLVTHVGAFAQETDNWDNQIYIGNKVGWGSEHWRYSGELQVRLKDNFTQLDNWFLEGVAAYLPFENWEIVPDIRVSIKPEKNEFRPGLGVFYKHKTNKSQLVHQLKWQIDIDDNSNTENGLRYVLFYNHLINRKLIIMALGGGLYRWSEGFTGLRFMRFGGGLTWLINVQHSINFNYFLGITQESNGGWSYQGIPMLQLVININKEYNYLPAKYISF